MDRRLYPSHWNVIAYVIKSEANWTCEECGRPCRQKPESWGDFFDRVGWEYASEPWGRFVLTVAHLDHRPENCDRGNLRALCSACHCRYDLRQMVRKRYLKRERHGQLPIPFPD